MSSVTHEYEGSQTGRSGSRTALVCPSPARVATRQPSDPTDLSLQAHQGDGYTWVGEDESYGTDRCSRASYRLSRSCETVEPPQDACRRPVEPPKDASTAADILPSSAGTPKSRTNFRLYYTRPAAPEAAAERRG